MRLVRAARTRCTYLASRARAKTPAASGAAAEVPEWRSVQFPYRSVVAWNNPGTRQNFMSDCAANSPCFFHPFPVVGLLEIYPPTALLDSPYCWISRVIRWYLLFLHLHPLTFPISLPPLPQSVTLFTEIGPAALGKCSSFTTSERRLTKKFLYMYIIKDWSSTQKKSKHVDFHLISNKLFNLVPN